MVLQGPWHDDFLDTIQTFKIVSLRLSQSMGWIPQDLRFVKRMPYLRGIEVYHHDIRDISPLSELIHLEHIGLDCHYCIAPDFTRFAKLTRCFTRWRPLSVSLLSTNTLQELNIVGYPYTDLTELNNLTLLRVLKLSSRTLASLVGIQYLSDLNTLDLFRCVALSSIDSLQSIQQKLRIVSFDSCKKLSQIDALEHLINLKSLSINNCAQIKSLYPLRNSKKIEEICFTDDTFVQDGDLTLLLKLPQLQFVTFKNRRHYTHTRQQILRTQKKQS